MKDKVILQPIISEKSVDLAKRENKYTFKVNKLANKIEIARAIEEVFEVKAVNVRTIGMRPRKIRFGKKRIRGMKGAWKKAVVTLIEGDKIEIFDIK